MKGECIVLEAEPFSIVVLAGGRSSRMGQDKAVLPWGNRDFLNSMLVKLLTLSDDVVVVSNITRNLMPPIREVPDIIPQKGPLSGIHAGLVNARYARVFVTACDVPFLIPDIVHQIVNTVGIADGAVVVRKEKIEPLLACYHKSCTAVAQELLIKEKYSVMGLLDRVNWVAVTCLDELDDCYFMNVNTCEEYEKAKIILGKR